MLVVCLVSLTRVEEATDCYYSHGLRMLVVTIVELQSDIVYYDCLVLLPIMFNATMMQLLMCTCIYVEDFNISALGAKLLCLVCC